MNNKFVIPELLAPAGNLEKLKVAIRYGADAVYLGGQRYGLRAASENFTDEELRLGVKFAHKHSSKVFVVLNAYLHDEDMEGIEEYCKFLESIAVDAVIVSDLGVVRKVQSACKIPIHLSTQASCLNVPAAKLWRSLGIKRLIVGRELSIDETAQIKREADIEVEMFVHGAMCMAYSGQCSISNFTAGRDSNRGGCIQSCRFEYVLKPKANGLAAKAHFMSSKDMAGLDLISKFAESGIDSLKIEGRMKSVLYVATLCRAYRKALDALAKSKDLEKCILEGRKEIQTIPHRDYCEASFIDPAGPESVFSEGGSTKQFSNRELLGLILDVSTDRFALRLNKGLLEGETIEILPFQGTPETIIADEIFALNGERIEKAKQDTVICLPKSKLNTVIHPSMVCRVQYSAGEAA